MADPFDFEEFEFKPLTEGLGFHKKADKLADKIKVSNQTLTAQPKVQSSIFPESKPVAKPATQTRASSFLGAPLDLGESPASLAASIALKEASRTASQSISELMASLPPSLDFLDDKQDLSRPSVTTSLSNPASLSGPMATPAVPAPMRPQIFQPLAREEYQPDYKSSIATGPTVGSVLPAPGTKAGGSYTPAAQAKTTMAAGSIASPNVSPYGARMAEGFAKAFPIDMPRDLSATPQLEEGLAPVPANFSAGLIDGMVVAGLSTILLVCIITITHINLVAMLSNAKTDGPTQLNLVFLFFAVLQMYMLVARAFFGATLGEWAFDLQMGTTSQQRSLTYPLQVVARTLVTTLTGLLPLALLSFAFRRDLGRYFSGLQLFHRT